MKYAFMKHASPVVRLLRPAPALLRAPVSRDYGFDRGMPVDRHYIERFMARHASAIRGRVLEVKSADYTKRFGTNVTGSDVLDIDTDNAAANVIADLQTADAVPADTYDCFIVTQTLQYVYDLKGAVGHCHRFLKTGGTVLATVPTCLQMDKEFLGGEYWRLTGAACQRIFGDVFGAENVTVEVYGNFIASTAILAGAAVQDLAAGDLDAFEPEYPIVACVAATKV